MSRSRISAGLVHMKYIYLLLVLLVFTPKTFAQEWFFDYSVESPLIQSGSTIDVTFDYKIEGYNESEFLVKPVVDRGFILSDNFFLSKTFPISIQGLNFGKANLHFEVWDTKTGCVYKTPTKQVWVGNIYKNYISRLNTNLKAFVNVKMDR